MFEHAQNLYGENFFCFQQDSTWLDSKVIRKQFSGFFSPGLHRHRISTYSIILLENILWSNSAAQKTHA
jgi:hypothetical protein